MNILRKLKERFPTHEFTAETVADFADFKSYRVLWVDGKPLESRFDIEAEQNNVVFEGQSAEQVILKRLIDEVEKALRERETK